MINKIRDKKNSKKVFYLYHGQNKYNQDYDIFVGEIKDINLHIKNLNSADLYNMKYFDLSNDKIIKLKSIGKNKILNYDLSKIDLLLSQIKN